MIDAACAALQEAHPEMFKPSKACKPPHLNIDRLREELFESEMLQAPDMGSGSGVRSSQELLVRILGVNEQLRLRTDAEWVEQTRGRGRQWQAALSKARQHGLFIGMDKMWLYKI